MTKIAIIGAGNIGTAIANGLKVSGSFPPSTITLTRRKIDLLDDFKNRGFNVIGDNRQAVRDCDVIILAVEPLQADGVLEEIAPGLDDSRHTLISVVTGITIKQMANTVGDNHRIVRAMPNTAIAVRESMTCLASNGSHEALETASAIFETVGATLHLDEEQMIAATALGACGIAFFLRAIRAASQGGIEIGFRSEDALFIAAQTAKGAASLLSNARKHPEFEIDKVTTPRGCTIAGLNRMEHEGFSSAMIRGITVSAEKAAKLYSPDGDK